MSQFGMQMPGAKMRRGSSPDVYTALAVFATGFLIAACAVMWTAATKVGKDGSPFGLQDPTRIELKTPAK
jgi:hypothetical protein